MAPLKRRQLLCTLSFRQKSTENTWWKLPQVAQTISPLIHALIESEMIDLQPLARRKCQGKLDVRSLPDNEDTRLEFRFCPSEIALLAEKLELPVMIVARSRHRCDRVNALALLLARLSSPKSLRELAQRFGMTSHGHVSSIINATLGLVFDRWQNIIKCNERCLESRLQYYSTIISRTGAHLDHCVGFVDGTNREMCRPTIAQGVFYSGHKHYHSYKFQSLLTPDGLISHLHGAEAGSRHDMYMFHRSGLQDLFNTDSFRGYCMFADQGYTTIGNLVAPYESTGRLTRPQREFNRSMIRPRLAVEHGFMRVSQLFPFFQRASNLKVFQMPLGRMYAVAVFLSNIRTCIDGKNQISSYFNCDPPTLDDYLS